MFKKFFQVRKQKRAIEQWLQSTLGQALTEHTQKYFRDNPRLSAYGEEVKCKQIDHLINQVFEITSSDNPISANREALVGYVTGYATLQVLCLKETEKADAFYADSPYISGELYKFIDAAAAFNKELDETKWKYPDTTSDDLIEFCNTRSVLLLYYVNGLNLVRIALEDFDNDKDWFKPFVKSMLIWEEDNYREKLGIPSLLPGTHHGLIHSTFMNAVLNGQRNPYYDWARNWSDINGLET